MVRKKLAVAIAALGALQADFAGALGLGDVALNSALNQPLNAEIQLLNASDLDKAQIRIELANPADFEKAGVSRDYFLTNIKFNVELDGSGGGVIKLTTREQVIEPYMNFLIEARWPTGRMLREYTVLLDLPVFSKAEAAPVNSAVVESTPAAVTQPRSQSNAAVSSVSSRRAESPRSTLAEGQLQPGEKYRVRSDDTLWEIASKSRPATEVSVQKTMVGIQRLNPQAFIKGNINRLKAGSVLRLPTANDIASISNRQAVTEVAQHNRAWRSGEEVSAPMVDAPLDATTEAREEQAAPAEEPRLSIATPGQSSTSGEGDDSGEAGLQSLQDTLDAQLEDLDKTQRDNEELQSRLDDMESKMATLQRLLQLKDDQLAAMQGSMAEQQGQDLEATINDPDTESTVTPVVQPTAPDQSELSPEPKPKTKAAAPVKEQGLLDMLLSNPLYAGGAGALLLALVLLIMRRRGDAEQDLTDSETLGEPDTVSPESFTEAAEEEVVVEPEIVESLDETEDLIAELEQEISAGNELEAAPVEAEPESVVQPETGDAIAEADIYVAYGRYQQAIDLLTSAINQQPERSDLQVKLMEVYLETRDKPAFQQQYSALQSLGDAAAVASVKEMLSTVDGVADWLDDLPDSGPATDNAGIDQADMASADEDALDLSEELDIDLDLDGFEEVAETEQGDLDGNDFEFDLGLDDDLSAAEDLGVALEEDISSGKTLEFDAIAADLESSQEQAETDADESFSLDESFELGEDLELGEELDLDFDLDEQTEAVENIEQGIDKEATNQPQPELEQEAAPGTDEGFDLDLDADGELDLDLDSLNESELGDLEAEFGNMDAVSSGLELNTEESSQSTIDSSATAAAEDSLDFTPPAASVDESFDEAVDTEAQEEDFDFLADSDEVATKLDLARAYIDMGDAEGAKDILDEVLQEGDDKQKHEANELLERVE